MKSSCSRGLRMLLAATLVGGSVGIAFGDGRDEGVGAKVHRAERKAVREVKKERTEDRIEARKDRREAHKDKVQEAKSKRAENVQAKVDEREERQAKRIQHGIAKGYLTADEIAKLNAQQQSIATLEASFKGDGKLTAVECRGLRTELNEASRCIWAEKHDDDGIQMPTYRLGKNVFARSELTDKLDSETLTAAEARSLLKEFHRTVELRRLLATGDLSAPERSKLQEEYDALLNKYFEVR